MHRFYLPPEQCCGTSLLLAGREAHHALHVLRVQQGERVTVLDGAGHVPTMTRPREVADEINRFFAS